jgi:predicted hydrocarbon binding protein
MAATMLDLVRKTVERRYGRTTWASLVGAPAVAGAPASGMDGEAGAPRSGPTEADVPSDALACWLGRQAVARLARQRPELFRRQRDLRTFLLALHRRTHGPALYEVALPSPAVDVYEAVDGQLLVSVVGEAACCALVEGLIAGAADRYGEAVRLELLKCRKRGDNRCVIRVSFDTADSDAGFYLAPLSAADGLRARVV